MLSWWFCICITQSLKKSRTQFGYITIILKFPCHYVLVACSWKVFYLFSLPTDVILFSFKWWISSHYPTSSLHTNFIHIVIFVHVIINSTIWRFLLAIFIQCVVFISLVSFIKKFVVNMLQSHPSGSFSSIWQSSLKLFGLIKLMLSNFIDFIGQICPSLLLCVLQWVRPTGGAHSLNVGLDLGFISS